MRKVFILPFAVLFLMGMGGKRPVPETPETPPPSTANSPQAYEQSFRSLAATYGSILVGKTIAFSFRTFFGSTIGMCTMNGSGRNSIAFSSSAWNNGSDTFKEMLAFHELGHCLLGRGHKNTSHSDGRKESIMNSSIFDTRVYTAHRDEYLKELFTVIRQTVSRSAVSAKESDEQIFDGCQFGK